MSLWNSFTNPVSTKSAKSRRSRLARHQSTRRLAVESLEDRRVFSASPLDVGVELKACEYQDAAAHVASAEVISNVQGAQSSHAQGADPVLMVISNQDFWYQDYADTRAALEGQGLEVIVAATSTDAARPHANSGQGADGGFVQPDLALADVEAEDYSGIVFSGGWGMAQYQYGFEGTYHNSLYEGELNTKEIVNDLVGEFLDQDKHVAAVCYGVSVLAYARVDGESPLAGRTVTGWNGPAPFADGARQSSRMQIESSGAKMLESGAIGDPTTATDDVWIDGNIITAENYDSARAFGEVVAREIIAAHQMKADPASRDARSKA